MLKHGTLLRHFKGKAYLVKCDSRDSESMEQELVYQALYGDNLIWSREHEMFTQVVDDDVVRFKEITLDELTDKELVSLGRIIKADLIATSDLFGKTYNHVNRAAKREGVVL